MAEDYNTSGPPHSPDQDLIAELRAYLHDQALLADIDAENLVGGQHNRKLAEAKDCRRWSDALSRLQAKAEPRPPVLESGSEGEEIIVREPSNTVPVPACPAADAVERVKLAIFRAIGQTAMDSNCHTLQSGRIFFDGDFDAEAVARAAIEAMREPTREMKRAGADAEFLSHRLGEGTTACVGKAPAVAAYAAMIDAALAPPAAGDTGAGLGRDGSTLKNPDHQRGEREEIARIIDPDGWEITDNLLRAYKCSAAVCAKEKEEANRTSLAKADAILAILSRSTVTAEKTG